LTVQDLFDRIDWSYLDKQKEEWLSRLPEEKQELEINDEWKEHRVVLLTGALYASTCGTCGCKVVYPSECSMCEETEDFEADWKARGVARQVLGMAWNQAVDILKSQGLIKNS